VDRFKLITGRTLIQGSGKEKGKFSEEYIKETSMCEIDPEDMKKLSIVDGDQLLIRTKFGKAIAIARSSKHTPHKGLLFIPYGPIANLLTNPETNSSGMPTLKGIEAEIEKEA
jgi:formylmethanofuran dehydrogenase subunit D